MRSARFSVLFVLCGLLFWPVLFPGAVLAAGTAGEELARRVAAALSPGLDPDEVIVFAALPRGLDPEASLAAPPVRTGSGRVRVVIARPGGHSFRLSGRIMRRVSWPVPNRRLVQDRVITAGDLAMRTLLRPSGGAAAGGGRHATSVGEVAGMAPTRALPPGQPVPLAALGPPVVVARDTVVRLVLRTPAMELTTLVRALENGRTGEMIMVENPGSRRRIPAIVAGPGQVRALAGIVGK